MQVRKGNGSGINQIVLNIMRGLEFELRWAMRSVICNSRKVKGIIS